MPPHYLLDTNILSDLVRRPQGTVAARIVAAGEETICTSIVVAAELRFGAIKSGSRKLVDRVDLILSAVDILSLEAPADHHYGKLRHHLTSQGTPIGPNDMLIAAHALSAGLTVVTANTDEFSRVPGLNVENWLTEQSILRLQLWRIGADTNGPPGSFRSRGDQPQFAWCLASPTEFEPVSPP